MVSYLFQGVIFSIDCSISNKILTTTSDDRSIKIWKLDFPDKNEADWAACSINGSKSMFGHTARVFQHKIISNGDKIVIVTVGEDSNVCIWAPDGRLVSREFIADGVSLHNLVYDNGRQLLFLCGNDGNIHQLPLKNILEDRKFIQNKMEISDLCSNEYPAKLVVMQDLSILIILTNHRNLFYKKLSSTGDIWRPIQMPSDPYKVTVIEANGHFFAIGGFMFATIFKFENNEFKIVMHEKLSADVIRAFKFIDRSEFAICDGRGNGAFFVTNSDVSAIEKRIPFELPVFKEQWFTACGRYNNFLIVSDRNGHLLLFEMNLEANSIHFEHSLRHVNGILGCTKFQPVKSDGLQFETIGHDGTVKTIAIDEITKKMNIQWRKTIPLAWCDKIYIRDENRWLLAGFNDSHFIMWQNDGEFRFEFDCGGGHRYWDIFINEQQLTAQLIFIRHKIVRHVTFNLNDSQAQVLDIPKTNWHTRPCNIMRIIAISNESHLLISGGEDNCLKFSVFEPGKLLPNKRFLIDFVGNMVSHISSIKAIHLMPISPIKLLLFSAGGRAQICVTEVTVESPKKFKFSEKCDFMLRSTDLERKRSGVSRDISFDPETRFMDLITYEKMDEIHLVAVCSDGYVRCFQYANDMISLNKSLFYGRCILSTHHIVIDGQNILLTMATDGLIQFWSLDDFHEHSSSIFTLQHHESGINSFDVLAHDENLIYLATGGDDQAIVLSLLEIKTPENSSFLNFNVIRTEKYPYNHTAQVNGVKFCKKTQTLYTISVDQSIMQIDLVDFSSKYAGYSCISDVKGLQVLSDQSKLIAYGCGVQILDLSK